MKKMWQRIPCVLSLCSLVFLVFCQESHATAGKQSGEKPKQPTLEKAILAFNQKMLSKEKKQQEEALRFLLPTKKDLETLFPKHAEKLWPDLDKYNQYLLSNVEKFAAEQARFG